MTLPPKWKRVVKEARKSGRFIVQRVNSTWVRKTQDARSVGIVMYEDGTAYRTDIGPVFWLPIRTESEAMKALGL
jgi:hypothetical protein